MIYYLLKYTMLIALRLFFRKIYFVNKNNIPTNGPVILASMHPNSFVDDFVLGAFLKRELRFLARGDVFKTKTQRFLLNQMFVSPIYRAMDNPKDVKKNIEAFELYTKILKRNGTLLIHSEGICVNEKRVRKLKKGTGRIAFGAEEAGDFKLGVQIVPVSLNYTNAPKVREDIMVEFSEPIMVSDYKELYSENPSKAILALNRKIYKSLNERAVVIDDKQAEPLAEQCLEMARNNTKIPIFPIHGHNPKRFILEKEVTDRVNKLFKESKGEFGKVAQQAESYFNTLKQNRINDKVIAKQSISVFLSSLLLLIAGPLFLVGFLLNRLPSYWGRRITNKVVKTVEFNASVFVGASWLLSLIYYTVLLIVGGVFFGILGLLTVIGIGIAGFVSVLLHDQYKILAVKYRFIKLSKSQPEVITSLKQQREQLMQMF